MEKYYKLDSNLVEPLKNKPDEQIACYIW